MSHFHSIYDLFAVLLKNYVKNTYTIIFTLSHIRITSWPTFYRLEVERRSSISVLQSSLSEKPSKVHPNDGDNKVRYKLLIDSSEDESVRRLLFSFKIVDPSTTKTYMCSDFPEDSEVQKVRAYDAT